MIWRIKNQSLPLKKTLILGVVNVTPDSFSDGGLAFHPRQAFQRALHLAAEGADILDLGAESTRPGAAPVDAEEELRRLVPVLDLLAGRVSVPISVDTTKAEVARVCLERGAQIINDVSGLRESGPEMAHVIRRHDAGIILMHRRGNPATMQSLARYQNVTEEVLTELRESVALALDEEIAEEQIAIDPGLGFAKTPEHNVEILRHLDRFHDLGRPLILGPSRKSFLGKLTGREIHEREFATQAVIAYAYFKGVHGVRVHHAAATRDVLTTLEAIGESHVRAFQMGLD